MKISCIILLLWSCEARSVRWYIGTHNLSSQIPFARAHSDAIDGWYVMAGNVYVEDDGSAWVPKGKDLEEWKEVIHSLRYVIPGRNLTVYGVGSASINSMLSLTALKGIPGIVQHVKDSGTDGILIDFETERLNKSVTREIAIHYSIWLHALGSALHKEGRELGFDVADFSAISVNEDFFFNYAVGGAIDFFTSMTPTYNGNNVAKDEKFSKKLKLIAGAERTRLGVGSMQDPKFPCQMDYNWTQPKFNEFMTFLKTNDFHSVDVWSCDISLISRTASWFIDEISAFLKR